MGLKDENSDGADCVKGGYGNIFMSKDVIL